MSYRPGVLVLPHITSDFGIYFTKAAPDNRRKGSSVPSSSDGFRVA